MFSISGEERVRKRLGLRRRQSCITEEQVLWAASRAGIASGFTDNLRRQMLSSRASQKKTTQQPLPVRKCLVNC